VLSSDGGVGLARESDDRQEEGADLADDLELGVALDVGQFQAAVPSRQVEVQEDEVGASCSGMLALTAP